MFFSHTLRPHRTLKRRCMDVLMTSKNIKNVICFNIFSGLRTRLFLTTMLSPIFIVLPMCVPRAIQYHNSQHNKHRQGHHQHRTQALHRRQPTMPLHTCMLPKVHFDIEPLQLRRRRQQETTSTCCSGRQSTYRTRP